MHMSPTGLHVWAREGSWTVGGRGGPRLTQGRRTRNHGVSRLAWSVAVRVGNPSHSYHPRVFRLVPRHHWCGVVWCGVAWCGVVWCGVVWCGVVWCGVVWCGVVWCGVVWCGVVWCGVVWCGVVWCGAVRCGEVWCGVVWCAEGAVTKRQKAGMATHR